MGKGKGSFLNKLDWRDLIVLSIFIGSFLLLCSYFFDFTLDDAYITFRYSKHLANGPGIVWNIGEDPVEGYTSFLWMVLMTIPIKLGYSPVIASKIISIVAGIISISLIYLYGRFNYEKSLIPIIGASALSLNPAFAFITVQGMETTLASLFVLVLGILSIKLLNNYNKNKVVLLGVFSLLAFLIRPDLVIFLLTLLSLILLIYLINENWVKAKQYILILAFVLALPLITYMYFRTNYFGYLFPNSFYVKESSGIFSLLSISRLYDFIFVVMAPYLLLIFYSLAKNKSLIKQTKDRIPLFVSLSFFLFLYFFIDSMQGFLFRFQMPTFPAFIFLFVSIVPDIGIPEHGFEFKDLFKDIKNKELPKEALVLFFCLFMVFHPLNQFHEAKNNMETRWQTDRVIVGKKLSAISERNYTMFVSESGALPYYSNWKAADVWGLNSEYIAHNGLSVGYLEELNPELIILLSDRTNLKKSRPTIYEYMVKNDYMALAAIKKTGESKAVHLYFVKPGGSSQIIADHLLGISNLTYLNVEKLGGWY